MNKTAYLVACFSPSNIHKINFECQVSYWEDKIWNLFSFYVKYLYVVCLLNIFNLWTRFYMRLLYYHFLIREHQLITLSGIVKKYTLHVQLTEMDIHPKIDVADLIRGKKVVDAINILSSTNKKSSQFLLKSINFLPTEP